MVKKGEVKRGVNRGVNRMVKRGVKRGGLWVYPCAMRGNWGNDGER